METAIHSASNKKTLLNDNHNCKETWFTLKSAKSNSYLIAPAIPQIMLTHPILNYLLELIEKGVQIHNWLEEISDTGIVLPNGKKVPKEELVYYYTYYKLLEDSVYFGKRKKHPMRGVELLPAHLLSLQTLHFNEPGMPPIHTTTYLLISE